GIYAPEEMSQWEEENKSKSKLPENKGPKMMEKSQKAAVWKMAQLKGMDLEQLKKFTEDNMLNGLDHLTYDQAEQLIKIISSYEHTVEEKQDEIITDADFEEITEDGEVTETEF
ncbi:hypothetical protein RZS08_25705, partial [Arthrospira platensis SPKY1]|nr:hypothetical protein [Arthrospira platensis SPKY1]